jgi:hypothetical protein
MTDEYGMSDLRKDKPQACNEIGSLIIEGEQETVPCENRNLTSSYIASEDSDTKF